MSEETRDILDDADHEELKYLLDHLCTDDLCFVPVRHHSPACAWHLARLIRKIRPASILIEGPESLSEFIPDLANAETTAPVALFVQFVDRAGHTLTDEEKKDAAGDAEPPRYGAFYPLCDYSPELVAIREGKAVGAQLAFCDLDYPQQVVREFKGDMERDRLGSLLDERHLTQNRYLKELARRRGCRDTNELWDRMFESEFQSENTEEFIKRVAAYCHFARRNSPAERLSEDGTLAREQRMLEIITKERSLMKRRKSKGPLLVVTGGFHTPALVAPETVAKKEKLASAKLDKIEVIQSIIRYSFPQLDALNGYAAGMPSPRYYQRLWERVQESPDTTLESLSREILVDLPAKARAMKVSQSISTADAIAAHQQACSLAAFRGNPGPLREDVLDGIRSSFVKGALDAEGELVLDLALELMCGDAVGVVPSSSRVHPILLDFQKQCTALRIQLETASPKETALEIYRKDRHVRMSRLFHMLGFLGAPFARMTSGPDFFAGSGLSLQIEHWTYQWSPQVESALLDASMFGSDIKQAVIGKLQHKYSELAAEGKDQGATAAVALLVTCCRFGLHQEQEKLIGLVNDKIQAESDFGECLSATAQLDLLLRYRSPLEGEPNAAVPTLRSLAYARSCYLVGNLVHAPEDAVSGILDILPSVREILVKGEGNDGLALDADLFWDAASALAHEKLLHPVLRGGFHGLLYLAGRLSTDDILNTIRANLMSADAHGLLLPRYIQGLLTLCRDLAWQTGSFLTELNQIIAEWSEDDFMAALPHLRLAFSRNTPQETDRVAKALAQLTDDTSLEDWMHRDVTEEDMLDRSRIAARVHESLKQDKLLSFLQS